MVTISVHHNPIYYSTALYENPFKDTDRCPCTHKIAGNGHRRQTQTDKSLQDQCNILRTQPETVPLVSLSELKSFFVSIYVSLYKSVNFASFRLIWTHQTEASQVQKIRIREICTQILVARSNAPQGYTFGPARADGI